MPSLFIIVRDSFKTAPQKDCDEDIPCPQLEANMKEEYFLERCMSGYITAMSVYKFLWGI